MKSLVTGLARSVSWLLVALAAAVPWAHAQDSSARPKKPNVLFIAIDDLNDWTGMLGGHPQALTPNLDRLARRGVLFTNAHCAAPACNPSRAALMTGVPPYRSGVYRNNHPWRDALPAAVTIPQHFRAHGYAARGSGKIFHGPYPDPASWDEYYPSLQKQMPSNPVPEGRPLNGIPNARNFDWGPLDIEDDTMGDAKVAAWVREQLLKKHDRAFFLACGFYRPHLPWFVPEKYFERFPLERIVLPEVKEDDLDDVPAAGRKMARPGRDHPRVLEHGQWKHAVRAYLASIAFTDAMLGTVLDALDRGPNAADTVVVLWTDHGWHLGEKKHWRKFTLWEEATRAPLIIVAPEGTPGLPEGTPRGARCARPVSLMDIYPTLISLCKLKPRPGIAGQCLLPLLKDPGAKWDGAALITYGRGNHAVRTERWRYIRYADGGEELYDHARDPREWTNLAADPRFKVQKRRLADRLPERDAPAVKQGGRSRKQ